MPYNTTKTLSVVSVCVFVCLCARSAVSGSCSSRTVLRAEYKQRMRCPTSVAAQTRSCALHVHNSWRYRPSDSCKILKPQTFSTCLTDWQNGSAQCLHHKRGEFLLCHKGPPQVPETLLAAWRVTREQLLISAGSLRADTVEQKLATLPEPQREFEDVVTGVCLTDAKSLNYE